jgi:hypothetical protein
MKPKNGTAHKLPQDIRSVLDNDEMVKTWNSLTPLARNEWICWVISVKQPSTREKHLERLMSDLNAGKRRPCCWYGCIHRTDKATSPSVKAIVSKKQTST